MGTYVAEAPSVPSISLASTGEEIESIFTWLREKADTADSDLSSFLTDLGDQIPKFSSSTAYPTLPVAPMSSFNWTADNISTEMYLSLFNQISSDIASGGTGFSNEVHDAIVARELAARRTSEERTYQGALDNAGTDGFDLPSGQIAAMERDFARDIEAQNQAVINDLLAKDFDIVQRNKEFSITSGLQLEGMIRETFSQLQSLNLDAAKAAEELIVQVYQASIAGFESAWNGIKAEIEAHSVDASLAEKIAEVRASVAVQALASALGGINASMSMGYSTGRSVNYGFSWGLSNSLNETHSYIEDPPA
jgi:BMFP domain-containing protein YqiC